MEYSLLIFIPLWLFLIYIASISNNKFILFFVLCQFLFVGAGLIVFGFLDRGILYYLFPSFSFSSLSDWHFIKASLIVYLGTLVTVFFSFSFFIYSEAGISNLKNKQLYNIITSINGPVLSFLTIVVLFSCSVFIVANYLSMAHLISATDVSELSKSLEMRTEATSNYILVLIVYNLAPAVALAALVYYLKNRSFINAAVFVILFTLAFLSLLLTFQKRPLIVFLGGIVVVLLIYLNYDKNADNFSLIHILRISWKYIAVLFLILLCLYYFYTGYRFENSIFTTIAKLLEIVVSRVLGRLSLPAAMYADYFPRVEEFYGLTNIGLLSSILDSHLFLDTKYVFTYYSDSSLSGNVAASVFIDAYGQGGFLSVLTYGFIVSLILVFVNNLFIRHSSSSASSILIFSYGCIFVYYLSQASLFRSLLGYGGIIYFFVWFFTIKRKVILIGR